MTTVSASTSPMETSASEMSGSSMHVPALDVCGLDDEEVTSIEGKGVEVEETGWMILDSDAKSGPVGTYKLPMKYLQHVPYFNALLEDKTCHRATIPQPSEQLGDIVAFLKIEQGIPTPIVPKPLRSKNLSECLPNALPQVNFIEALWDKKGKRYFRDVTNAANYLGMNGLLCLCCAKFATIVKGQPKDQVKAILAESCGEKRAEPASM